MLFTGSHSTEGCRGAQVKPACVWIPGLTWPRSRVKDCRLTPLMGGASLETSPTTADRDLRCPPTWGRMEVGRCVHARVLTFGLFQAWMNQKRSRHLVRQPQTGRKDDQECTLGDGAGRARLCQAGTDTHCPRPGGGSCVQKGQEGPEHWVPQGLD